jgi:hypothetical protein
MMDETVSKVQPFVHIEEEPVATHQPMPEQVMRTCGGNPRIKKKTIINVGEPGISGPPKFISTSFPSHTSTSPRDDSRE